MISTRTVITPAFWEYPPPIKRKNTPQKLKGYNFVLNVAPTHPLMVAIICGKYENNRSRTENVTERTRFSKSRSNDLEDIDQGQRSLYATYPLILVIIFAKYSNNPSRTEVFFSRSRLKNFKNLPKIEISRFYIKNATRDTPSNYSDHLCQI